MRPEQSQLGSDEPAVALCPSRDLVDGGQAVPFDLRYGGQTCRAFAVRFQGVAQAYLNRCSHVAMELDWQPDRFFDASGQWLVTPTEPIVSGSVSVIATDTAGNTSPAKTLPLLIDKSISVPVVSLGCDSGVSATDKVSNNAALSVFADSGDHIEYSTNGSSWASSFTATEGVNTVYVRATDAAGNTATSQPLTFTLDTIVPVYQVALNCDTAVPADKITQEASLTLSDVETSTALSFSSDGGRSWVSTFVPTEGHNLVTVRVTDVAGNVRPLDFSFTLDSLRPSAPVVSLVHDSGVRDNDHITVDVQSENHGRCGTAHTAFFSLNP